MSPVEGKGSLRLDISGGDLISQFLVPEWFGSRLRTAGIDGHRNGLDQLGECWCWCWYSERIHWLRRPPRPSWVGRDADRCRGREVLWKKGHDKPGSWFGG